MQLHHFEILFNLPQVFSGESLPVVIEAHDHANQLVTSYNGKPHVIVDKGIVSPMLLHDFKLGRWEGNMVLTGLGEVKIRIWDQSVIAEKILVVSERGEIIPFPFERNCPGCDYRNTINKTDVFRCVHCDAIYFVDKYGHVIPLKQGDDSDIGFVKHLEFRMPSDVNYLNHVRNFIVGISSEENIAEEKVAQIEMALDEALANVVEHAYAFDPYQEIHVEVWLYSDKIEIILRDRGRSFDNNNMPLPDLKKHIETRKVGGLGRYLIAKFMDEVVYHSNGIVNELRMLKRF